MANIKLSSDVLLMFITALFFTVVGLVTGAKFFVILCGACLVLIVLELITSRGHITE